MNRRSFLVGLAALPAAALTIGVTLPAYGRRRIFIHTGNPTIHWPHLIDRRGKDDYSLVQELNIAWHECIQRQAPDLILVESHD